MNEDLTAFEKSVLLLLLSTILVLIIFVAFTLTDFDNEGKGLVYLEDVNKAQLSAYSKGYKAGYEQALTDVEEQKFLDGGAR